MSDEQSFQKIKMVLKNLTTILEKNAVPSKDDLVILVTRIRAVALILSRIHAVRGQNWLEGWRPFDLRGTESDIEIGNIKNEKETYVRDFMVRESINRSIYFVWKDGPGTNQLTLEAYIDPIAIKIDEDTGGGPESKMDPQQPPRP